MHVGRILVALAPPGPAGTLVRLVRASPDPPGGRAREAAPRAHVHGVFLTLALVGPPSAHVVLVGTSLNGTGGHACVVVGPDEGEKRRLLALLHLTAEVGATSVTRTTEVWAPPCT